MIGFEKLWIRVSTSDGHFMTLEEPLVYFAKSGERIEAPAGICSDGASTPKAIWNILPPFGKYWLATVLHDYLYRISKRPKQECDALLLEAMETLDVPALARQTIYEAVNLCGSGTFHKDRNETGEVASG